MTEEALKSFQQGVTEGAQKAAADFDKGSRQIEKSNESLQGSLKETISVVKEAASIFGLALGAHAVVDYVKGVVEMGSELHNLAEQTGISASTLSGLKSTIEIAGGSVTIFSRGLYMAQKQIGEIKNTSDPAYKAIKELGLSFQELTSANTEDFLKMLVEALAKIEDPIKRNVLGNALLGRTFRELIPVLDQLAGKFDQLKKSGFSDEQIKALHDLEAQWIQFSNTMLVRVGVALVNVLQRLRDVDREAAETGIRLRMFLQTGPLGLPGAATVAGMQAGGAAGLGAQALLPPKPAEPAKLPIDKQAEDRIKAVTKSLQEQEVAAQGQAMAFDKGEEASKRFEMTQRALAQLQGGQLTPKMKELIEQTLKWQGVVEGNKLTLESYKTSIKEAGEHFDALTKAQTGMAEIQDKLSHGYDMSIDALDSLKDKLIGVMGAAQDAGVANKDMADTFNILLKSIESFKDSAAFRTAIPSMVESADQALEQLQIRLGNIKPQGIEPLTKSFEQLFDSITSGMDSTLQGVMQGTQSIGDAFRKMAQNIGISIAQTLVQLSVLNPIKNAIFGNQTGYTAAPTLDWSKVFSGVGSFFTNLFHAQGGGIVPGLRGSPVPIIAHGGERIVPLGSRDSTNAPRTNVTINGDIIPRQPGLTKEQVIQIGFEQFNSRGLWMQTAEQRLSPTRR
jgi:hypothetical protein